MRLKCKKAADLKSEIGQPLFCSAHLRYGVFPADIPHESHPCVARSAYRRKRSILIHFRFRVQRYNNYLTYANFLAKKCTYTLNLENLQIAKDTKNEPRKARFYYPE